MGNKECPFLSDLQGRKYCDVGYALPHQSNNDEPILTPPGCIIKVYGITEDGCSIKSGVVVTSVQITPLTDGLIVKFANSSPEIQKAVFIGIPRENLRRINTLHPRHK